MDFSFGRSRWHWAKLSYTSFFSGTSKFLGKGLKKGDHDFTAKSKLFRQINVFTKEVTKKLISRNFLAFSYFVQCFKSRDDNFLSNQPFFQTHFSHLPPIRVWKFKVNQELRKVCLKLTLTNKIISRKIVVSRIETLYTCSTFYDFGKF